MKKPTVQQQKAIDAEGSILLSAGAGTGKTATLVSRCVRLVVEKKIPVDRLLVVTFTNAAAAEMKQRLREALQHELSKNPGDEDLQQQLLLLDTASISTIHAFCLQLIRSHFAELGLDPNVAVLDNSITGPMRREIVRQIIAAEISRDQKVRQLAEDYFSSDGDALAEQVIETHAFYSKQREGSGAIKDRIAFFERTDCSEWQRYRMEILREWVKEWRPIIKWQIPHTVAAFSDVKGYGGQSETADRIRELEKILPEFKERFCQLAPEFELKELTPILAEAAKMVGTGFWAKGTSGKQGLIKNFVAEAGELLAWLPRSDGDPLQSDWDAVRKAMIALLDLTRKFDDAYSAAKRTRGGVDFADQEQLALHLLRNETIAQQWRERFDHVVIDECQDINPAQDELIQKLRGSSAKSSLFMVGDVKQSIYRFRMADPGIFRKYADDWRALEGHQVLALNENFRSREGILGFANSLFGCLLRSPFGGIKYEEVDRLQLGLPEARTQFSLKPQPELSPKGEMAEPGYRVEIHMVDKSAPQAEDGQPPEESHGEEDSGQSNWDDLLDLEKQAQLAASRLKKLQENGHEIWDKQEDRFRPMNWGDVGILMRSIAGRAGAFIREFLRCGIPLVAEQGDFLATLEAQDLISLVRVLDNPRQDIPLFAVLRSPLAGFSLDELASLRATRGQGDAYDTLCNAGACPGAQSFLKSLARWRRLALMTSLSCVLETVLAETKYEAFLLTLPDGPDRVANVRRFLELARAYDPLQRQGIPRFLQFITEQQEAEQEVEPLPPRQARAVRLLSIHKSKGLEFPVVVVAGIGAQFNQQAAREKILLSNQWGGLAPRVVNAEKRERRDSLIWWQVEREEKRELVAEELRLLYVAVTRARDTLLLVGSYKPASKEFVKRLSYPLALGVPRAKSYCEWLAMWANSDEVTRTNTEAGEDIRFPRPGQQYGLRWRDYRVTDASAGDNSSPDPTVLKVSDAQLANLNWKYPQAKAVEIPAKTSASALHRLSALADEETTSYPVRRSVFHQASLQPGTLNAAAIGTAHHAFLQHLDLAKAGSEAGLVSELERMIKAGVLAEAEGKAVDLSAILKFWTSPVGARVLSVDPANVRRELPFTAAFHPCDLLPFKDAVTRQEEEMVVVQGFIDLAVLLPDQIWLVDFKTDRIEAGELQERAAEHAPQLRLYAMALERVYLGRKVTSATLCFLHTGQNADVMQLIANVLAGPSGHERH